MDKIQKIFPDYNLKRQGNIYTFKSSSYIYNKIDEDLYEVYIVPITLEITAKNKAIAINIFLKEVVKFIRFSRIDKNSLKVLKGISYFGRYNFMKLITNKLY